MRAKEKQTSHCFVSEEGKRRSRRRVTWGQIYRFYQDLEEENQAISYRAIARKLEVSPSTVKAWFDTGHLKRMKEEFLSLKEGAVSTTKAEKSGLESGTYSVREHPR